MRTETGKSLLGAAIVGEIAVDKLPLTPSRISPAPLLGRLGFGAASGLLATMATPPGRTGSVAARGALLGAIGAAAGAHAGYLTRTRIARNSGVPDAPIAVV